MITEFKPNDPSQMKIAAKISYFCDEFQKAKLSEDQKVECLKLLAKKLREKDETI